MMPDHAVEGNLFMTSPDLAARIQRLEDRNAIIEVVITYATSIDRGDWAAYADVFTDPVHIDFSEAGMPAGDFPRDAFAGFARQALEPWTARQHISPNHVVVFDDANPDTAVCHSYMYAQHHLQDAPGGDLYLMRGSYDNHLVRTPEGWKITRLVQHVSWLEGNQRALQEGAPA
jgi:ketosteroid isomerase-like protein